MKNKKLAEQILADNPGQNAVYITQDGQAFFNELDAANHSKRSDFKEEAEVFFREGFEPEDTKTLQEDYEAAVEKSGKLEEVILLVTQAVNLDQDAPEVSAETDDVVAKVIDIRQRLEKSEFEKNEISNANIDLVNELENSKTQILNLEKEKNDLAESFENLQNELDTLKANSVEVVEDKKSKK